MQHYSFSIPKNLANIRLDKALSEISGLSRTQIQELLKQQQITINGKIALSANEKTQENQAIEFSLAPKLAHDIVPSNMPINIVFEDEYLLVIDKQAGLTVHPGAGNHNDTLVNALMGHYGKELSNLAGIERPGIVHRLDRDTSGLMIVAKTNEAHQKLSSMIAEREVTRGYRALIWGLLNPRHGTINANIARSNRDRTKMTVVQHGGKTACTHYTTVNIWPHISEIECQLDTGRTHQIRVHLSHLGHSVIGDQSYGQNKRKIQQYCSGELRDYLASFNRQALHACRLEFIHPMTGEEISLTSALAPEMQKIIELCTPKPN